MSREDRLFVKIKVLDAIHRISPDNADSLDDSAGHLAHTLTELIRLHEGSCEP
jgi:hypothetical protein